jgi:RecA-family ATPase
MTVDDKYGQFGEISAEWLMATGVESIPYLWGQMALQVGVASMNGSSDAGKTALSCAFATAVSAGDSEFLGFPLRARHRRAVYISTEDDERAVSYLLRLQNRVRGRPPGDYAGLDYIFDTGNLIPRLDNLLAAKPADMVVVDTFADIYNGPMNENNRVRAFLQEFNQIAQRRECLILFLHHTGKRTEDLVPSKHNAIGSQGFEAKMRLVIELRSDPVDPSLKHLCIVKGNYLPAEFKQRSFVLHFDENMNFTNTGERTDFELLRRLDPEREQEQQDKAARARELQSQGLTLEQIAAAMGYKSKTSVINLLKNRDQGQSVTFT